MSISEQASRIQTYLAGGEMLDLKSVHDDFDWSADAVTDT
jgi:hypothetical protein